MEQYTIELSSDHAERNSFATWLENRGHTVTVGNTDRNVVDGTDEHDTQLILDTLWDEYCA